MAAAATAASYNFVAGALMGLFVSFFKATAPITEAEETAAQILLKSTMVKELKDFPNEDCKKTLL